MSQGCKQLAYKHFVANHSGEEDFQDGTQRSFKQLSHDEQSELFDLLQNEAFASNGDHLVLLPADRDWKDFASYWRTKRTVLSDKRRKQNKAAHLTRACIFIRYFSLIFASQKARIAEAKRRGLAYKQLSSAQFQELADAIPWQDITLPYPVDDRGLSEQERAAEEAERDASLQRRRIEQLKEGRAKAIAVRQRKSSPIGMDDPCDSSASSNSDSSHSSHSRHGSAGSASEDSDSDSNSDSSDDGDYSDSGCDDTVPTTTDSTTVPTTTATTTTTTDGSLIAMHTASNLARTASASTRSLRAKARGKRKRNGSDSDFVPIDLAIEQNNALPVDVPPASFSETKATPWLRFKAVIYLCDLIIILLSTQLKHCYQLSVNFQWSDYPHNHSEIGVKIAINLNHDYGGVILILR